MDNRRRAMTGAQKSYLKTLSDEAGEEFDETLTKAEAQAHRRTAAENRSRHFDDGKQGS
jgi:hypothetical protein